MLCLEEQYAKISILWNTPLPVRIAAKRFRWCWTYPCTSKLMWKIAKCAATPLRSVTPCRTKSWWNFRHGLWDDRRLKCQRILQRNPVIRSDQQLTMPSCGKVRACIRRQSTCCLSFLVIYAEVSRRSRIVVACALNKLTEKKCKTRSPVSSDSCCYLPQLTTGAAPRIKARDAENKTFRPLKISVSDILFHR